MPDNKKKSDFFYTSAMINALKKILTLFSKEKN
jgi:hypothetical protein